MKLIGSILVIVLGVGLLAWKLCFPRFVTTAAPTLEQQWDQQIYGLDNDEVIRFFHPALKVRRGRTIDPLVDFGPAEETHRVYTVNSYEMDITGESCGPDSVHSAINWCSKLSELEFEVPEDIPGLPTYGDWLIRDGTPTQRMMPALQSLLRTIGGNQITIECSMVDREVIVVSGKWIFRETKNQHPNFSYVVAPGTLLHYVKQGTLDDSFRSLQEKIHHKVINEVDQPQPQTVRWMSEGYLGWRSVDQCLSTLERQTSLIFTKTHRRIPIWFLRDQSTDTQPASSQ